MKKIKSIGDPDRSKTPEVNFKGTHLKTPSCLFVVKMALPNVLITGTPGVGKSRLCKELVERLENKYKWHNVSQVAKENDCVEGHDEEYDCPVLNEDKVRLIRILC